MKLVKLNKFELKALPDTPIYEERSPIELPFAVVNENNEVLFGDKENVEYGADGMVSCLVIEGLTPMESRKLCFALHYQGMVSVVGYKNFNTMDCPHPSLKNLYLWNTNQFEECARNEENALNKGTSGGLF